MAARMPRIVNSFPAEMDAPVENAAPTLFRILRSLKRSNFSDQLSKNILISPDMLEKYTGEPTMTASEDDRSVTATSPTFFRTTLVAETALAPSATPWAIFSVLPVAEW